MQKSFGGDWKYNEVVGYLQFYKWANDIRCAYYRGYDKKAMRNGKRLFYKYDDTIFKITIKKSYTNKKLIDEIKNMVDYCKSLKEFKKRYIDTDIFYGVIGYIDWNQFIFKNQI